MILKFFQKTLDKMIEFPKHLGFDYYLNMYVSSKNNKNNNFYIQTIIIFFIYRREDKDENNIKVVTDNITFFLN